jgi:hypothetical protein
MLCPGMILTAFVFSAVCSLLAYSAARRNYFVFKRDHPERAVDWCDVVMQHGYRHVTVITVFRDKTTEFYVGTDCQQCHETYDEFLADRSFRQTMPPYIFYWAPVLLVVFRRCGNVFLHPFRYLGSDNMIRSRS